MNSNHIITNWAVKLHLPSTLHVDIIVGGLMLNIALTKRFWQSEYPKYTEFINSLYRTVFERCKIMLNISNKFTGQVNSSSLNLSSWLTIVLFLEYIDWSLWRIMGTNHAHYYVFVSSKLFVWRISGVEMGLLNVLYIIFQYVEIG